MKKAWWKESVVYQVYPRSFCDSNGDGIGDLQGIISKLDYIQDLGANVIWMNPVYRSPNDDNGYDISDYQTIMDEFGTMEDFDALLAAAHQRGIRIVMDLVVNHTSDEHEWFLESRSSRDNPKRDFYIWREAKPDGSEPNNWGSVFSGSAWKWDEETQMYFLHCFSRKQPDLNWENPQVRNAVYDMMTWWCEKGIDGFRMDVINMISKPEGLPDLPMLPGQLYADCMTPYSISGGTCNGPKVHEYLEEMNRRVLSKYDILTVGECPSATLEEAQKYSNAQGTELNMVFQFEHAVLDHGQANKWSTRRYDLVALKENLSKWQNSLHEVGWNSLYYCNHDQPRIVSRLGDDSPASAKCIATQLHMMQGTPYVYQGEELGMTNCPFRSIEDYRDLDSINPYHDLTAAGLREPEELLEAIAAKSRDNARTPMQWSAEANAGFTTGEPWIMVNPNHVTINAASQVNDPDSVYHYYKKLIAMRRNSPWSSVIVYGSYTLLAPEDPAIFAFLRETGDQKLLVICNMSAGETSFAVSQSVTWTQAQLVVGSRAPESLIRELILAPWSASVWELK